MGFSDFVLRLSGKSVLAEHAFSWGPSHCHISRKPVAGGMPSKRALLGSIVEYMRWYFEVGDPSQVVPVYGYLCENWQTLTQYNSHVQGIFETVAPTYSRLQQDALFSVFLGVAPIDDWSESRVPEPVLYKQRVRLLDDLTSLTDMQLRMNIVFPAITIPVFYNYLCCALGDAESEEAMAKCTYTFLSACQGQDLAKIPKGVAAAVLTMLDVN